MNNKRNAWYEKFTSIIIAVLIVCVLAVFQAEWLEETYKMVYYTLGAAVVVQCLLPWRLIKTKILLQWMFAGFITMRIMLDLVSFAGASDRISFIELLRMMLMILHPYIWIVGAILLVYQVFVNWATNKSRIFITIGFTITIMTVVDSFTPFWLWDKVAVIILTSLTWLAAYHLRTIQRKYPQSWKSLLKYPFHIILPMLLVLSIVMLAGISMPATTPVLKDPYTLWKHAKGEKIDINVGDKIATNKGSGSNSTASSGYSRDDSKLGGGFLYDYSPVMLVTTDKKSYWRGESKTYYDGQGWTIEDSAASKRLLGRTKSVDKSGVIDEQIARSDATTKEIIQTITTLQDNNYPVLFGAGPITRVLSIDTDGPELYDKLSWSPSLWELRWNDERPEAYPGSYTIVSSEIIINEKELRSTRSEISERDLNDIYVQLPETVPERVKQLALEVTADAANDYDRAVKLQNFLSGSFTYVSQPDLSKLTGDSTDFVDQFLFELKEGYCDYFSTAMVVMARTLDMPARWVKGFAPGYMPASNARYDMIEDEPVADKDGAGTYTVRNSDAHSWVEVYFEGYGWVPFEPTAGFIYPSTTNTEEEVVEQEPKDEKEDNEEKTQEKAAETAKNKKSSVSLWWLLIIPAIALLVVALNSKKWLQQWKAYRESKLTNNERIIIEATKLLRVCGKHGFKREAHETLRESVDRWLSGDAPKGVKQPFLYVLEQLERASYSNSSASEQQLEQVSQHIEETKKVLAESKKLQRKR